eukprot:CAMPEP_0169397276 /NCGR_PEP_ID=MMETSP1017-20121227/51871_1 /TAXON_ID=342587 /ORGANISM="Karlodinium micrum, Strain CCMP2283" /LENGTH=52 /DNA_ID=CAMNT_0009501883 /DNA_START=123 /DNA_END=278 /DNA_ORIENTATION=-
MVDATNYTKQWNITTTSTWAGNLGLAKLPTVASIYAPILQMMFENAREMNEC